VYVDRLIGLWSDDNLVVLQETCCIRLRGIAVMSVVEEVFLVYRKRFRVSVMALMVCVANVFDGIASMVIVGRVPRCRVGFYISYYDCVLIVHDF
jgi:hypothetical protein